VRAIAKDIDERLLIEAAQRDPRHFAELYEHNFDRVYAYIARRVRDRDQAEDLTAEVFHHALAKLHRFEWRGVPFAAWLYRLAANAIADRWQRNGTQQEVPADVLDDIGVDDETERRAMLFELVEDLPPDQQLVIRKRFIEQRSTREIAEELGRSEGSIKQLQFRALQTLRERMRRSDG
jgi:RNA polymerase sigma-70 factor (ECF subfamily)